MKRVLLILSFLVIFIGLSNAQKVTISGFVYEAQSGEPLISASIHSGQVGTASNQQGFYSISLPGGEVGLEISYIGFETVKLVFDAIRDTVINIHLKSNQTLDAARKIARKDSVAIRSIAIGAYELATEQFYKTPMLLGEGDILKTLQLLPGVQSGISGLSGLYVRGGASSDNLLLLDGVSLYNAEHMLGLFSIFMPDAVKKVTLYKGYFPASYGGRSSSVVDVRTNDGNLYGHTGSVGISLLSSHIHLEGPISKGNTSYSISGRLMHTALTTPVIRRISKEEMTNYWFYDINAKITHKIGSRDKFGINVFNNRDHLFGEEHSAEKEVNTGGYTIPEFNSRTDIKWENMVACLHWGHVFSPRMFMDFSCSYNQYRIGAKVLSDELRYYPETSLSIQENQRMKYNSGIRDWQARTDFDFIPSHAHRIRFGASMIYHIYKPEAYVASIKVEEDGAIQMDTTRHDKGDVLISGLEGALYGEDEMKIGQHLTVRPGIHVSFFNVRSKSYINLQPRLAMELDIGHGISVKAGYSRMVQHVHLLSSSQITLPLDLWVPVTEYVRPEVSDQVSTGIFLDGLHGWSISLEAYYKMIQNVLEYKDGVSFLGNTGNWEDKVSMGIGRSRGLECMINKTTGATTGWVAYTLSKTERRFEEAGISRGDWFPYKYDRRHVISVLINHHFNSSIDIGATWNLATGGVITVPLQKTVALSPFNGIKRYDLIERRGNYRLPSSHRLNLGINFRKQIRRGERIWNISVYNAYNHLSPDLVDIISGNKLKITTLLPIVPSFGYSLSF